MISKIPEFIAWKSKIDGDMEGVKCIIAEALSDQGVNNFIDACGFVRDKDKETYFALHLKIAVDNYLESDGWYKIMAEDKAEQEPADDCIAQQDKDDLIAAGRAL